MKQFPTSPSPTPGHVVLFPVSGASLGLPGWEVACGRPLPGIPGHAAVAGAWPRLSLMPCR